MECASQLIEAVCPMCRFPLTEADVPTDVLRSISQRKDEYRREVDANNVAETLNLLRSEARVAPSRETIISTQVLNALTAVRAQNIPIRYMPTEIIVTVSPDGPLPSIGHIVAEMLVVNFITAVVADVGVVSDDDDDEDVEDAFDEENTHLAQTQRRIEVHFKQGNEPQTT